MMSSDSEDFEEEGWTSQDRYQFSEEEIGNSPSRTVGITEESENRRRIEAAMFIKHVGNHFLPKNTDFINAVCCNARWLWEQVYMRCNLAELDRYDAAIACFSLSAKAYDHLVKPRYLVEYWGKSKFPGVEFNKEMTAKMTNLLGIYEQLVASCVSLMLQPALPLPRVIMQKSNDYLGLGDDVIQLAHRISCDLMMFFDWSRRYDADVMAGVALYSSMTYHNVSMSPDEDGKSWIQKSRLKGDLKESDLKEYATNMVSTYRKRVPGVTFQYAVEILLGSLFPEFLDLVEKSMEPMKEENNNVVFNE